jgi:Transglutaminase-like superfamily
VYHSARDLPGSPWPSALGGAAAVPSSGVVPTYRTIPDGDAGAQATVGYMRQLILEGAVSPVVRRQAVTIASKVNERDYAGQIVAIRSWLQDHVKFLRDPDGQELLHEAALLVASIQQHGDVHMDCDDVAILGGALGSSIGLLARIVTVSYHDPRIAGASPFAHTWAELASPVDSPRWVELDTTRAVQQLDPRYIDRYFIVEV